MGIASQVRLYALDSSELGEAALARFAAALDAVESARAARFVFDKHRRRFIAAHGFLREVLARELDRQPAALDFELGAQGKPRVKNADLHFSLTHTGEHALVAVGNFELGLDAEEIRGARVDAPLARRVMTAEEFETWSQAPREAQVQAFFRLWSAKESVMKASGQGMSLGPDTFAVYQNAKGHVRLSSRMRYSGYRSIELRDEAGDGDFPELQGYFPERSRGELFFHFAMLAPAVDFARVEEVLLLTGQSAQDVAGIFTPGG